MTKITKKNWEEVFDQQYGATLWQEHKYKKPYKDEASQYVSCGEDIKEFIKELLSET